MLAVVSFQGWGNCLITHLFVSVSRPRGVSESYLAAIPTYVMLSPTPALLGVGEALHIDYRQVEVKHLKRTQVVIKQFPSLGMITTANADATLGAEWST